MKKHFISILIAAIAMLSFAASADAQTQDTDTPKAKKGWWQYGVSYRAGLLNPFESENSVVLNAGYRFNRKNYLGISAGYGRGNTYIDADCGADYDYNGIPVTLEYLHNFYIGEAERHSFYLGGEAGGLFSWESAEAQCEEGTVHHFGAGIAMLKTGMDFQLHEKLHMNFGIRLGFLALGFNVGISF